MDAKEVVIVANESTAKQSGSDNPVVVFTAALLLGDADTVEYAKVVHLATGQVVPIPHIILRGDIDKIRSEIHKQVDKLLDNYDQPSGETSVTTAQTQEEENGG